MPINAELVQRKITLILEDTIGRAVDINYHLVTESLLTSPKDYADSFIRLSQIGVLDGAAARAVAKLAGLRNRITHEYNGLDEKLIHAALGQVLTELPEYLRRVSSFLDAKR